MFDLTIYPISLDAGREQNELPSLLVANAPRRAARMRAQDFLILHAALHTIAPGSGEPAGAPYTAVQQQEMLRRLAETYFNFSGSVTAGLRAVAARMNEFLLSRNLKSAQEGQVVGVMNLAVVHGSSVIIGHAGPTHTFVLGKSQVQHFDDGAQGGGGPAGRGLGLSRLSTPRFYQASLEPGDLLVICPQPPAGWSERTLGSSPQLTFDHLRRRLLADAGIELKAALIRASAGKGLISYWKPSERARREVPAARTTEPTPAEAQSPAEAEVRTPDVEAVESVPDAVEPAGGEAQVEMTEQPGVETPEAPRMDGGAAAAPVYEAVAEEPAGPEAPAAPDFPAHLVEPPAAPPASAAVEPLSPRPGIRRSEPAQPGGARGEASEHRLEDAGSEAARRLKARAEKTGQADAARKAQTKRHEAAGKTARPRVERKPLQISLPFMNALQKLALGERLGSAWRKSAPVISRAGGAVSAAARRAVPQRRDPLGRPIPLFNLSTGTMLAVAVIVPLVVVAVATAVYFEAGRGEQYAAIFVQAQQYAQQAMQQEDPMQQRESWLRAFDMVRKAEKYQQTDESRTLRKQSQDALDALEGYTRLDFRPAVSPAFTNDVRITRMIATLNDVYLLDGSQGRILRLFRTATGYDLDPTFTCGPGKAGDINVGPLIDLSALSPTNDLRASVLGIDASGTLVYCSASVEGFDARVLEQPDLGWGGIQGMSLYGEKLYVLDPKTNGVYFYDGVNGIFEGKPRFYFGDTIPKMGDVIDIAIDQEFLYLLHDDGQMTICEGGGYSLAVTRCSDTPYGDSRPGYESSPLSFLGTRFTQIQTTQPPDPSLFALDVANRSIYHLSLRRLNLQRQYLPQTVTDFPLPEDIPSAFAVAPNRRALLAFDNQVYFALIP